MANSTLYNPDLGRVGGITPAAWKLKNWPNEAGARAVPSRIWHPESCWQHLPQWAAASEQPLTEYTRAPSPLAQKLAQHEMTFRNGALHLTDQPGLGVDLDEDVVAKFRVM